MPKTMHRLTDKQVQNAKPGAANDGGGLFLRVSGNGNRRWVFRFTLRGSKQREMGLGSYPQTSLATARAKAAAAREHVQAHRDPIDEAERETREAQDRKAQSAAHAITFARYAEEVFLPSVLPRFHSRAHIQQWEATFRVHAAPIQDLPLAEIGRQDILAIMEPIWRQKNVTATRSLQRLDRMFSHAIQNGAYEGDNPASWSQFDATLDPPRKLTKGHHASIPHEEIAEFYTALRARTGTANSALMLEWIILSACRTGEARFARWSEVDLERAVWDIPGDRTKTEKPHAVPLTARMLEILSECKRRHGRKVDADDFVFDGQRGGQPLSEMSCLMLLRRMGYPKGTATVHGFRSTFRDWAGTTTDFSYELMEEQLSHQLPQVQRAYARKPAVEKRRVMMESWASYVSADFEDRMVMAG